MFSCITLVQSCCSVPRSNSWIYISSLEYSVF